MTKIGVNHDRMLRYQAEHQFEEISELIDIGESSLEERALEIERAGSKYSDEVAEQMFYDDYYTTTELLPAHFRGALFLTIFSTVENILVRTYYWSFRDDEQRKDDLKRINSIRYTKEAVEHLELQAPSDELQAYLGTHRLLAYMRNAIAHRGGFLFYREARQIWESEAPLLKYVDLACKEYPPPDKDNTSETWPVAFRLLKDFLPVYAKQSSAAIKSLLIEIEKRHRLDT